MVRCWLASAFSWCSAGYLADGRRDPHDSDATTQVLKPVVVRAVDGAAHGLGVSAVRVHSRYPFPFCCRLSRMRIGCVLPNSAYNKR